MPTPSQLAIERLVKQIKQLASTAEGKASPDFLPLTTRLRDVNPEMYEQLRSSNWGVSQMPETTPVPTTVDPLVDPILNVDPRLGLPGTGNDDDLFLTDPNVNVPNLPGNIRPLTDEYLERLDEVTRTRPIPQRYLPLPQQDWDTNPFLLDFLGEAAPNDTSASDKYFDELMANISAPSSVDEVQRGVESDLMKQLLADIDRDTEGEMANLKLDFLDRGLGGPGQMSDIEGIALAQAGAEGGRKKASARSNYALAELGRIKAREEAARQALGGRYQAGLTRESQVLGTRNQRDLALAQALLQLEIERLSRKAGKYQPGSVSGGSGGGDWMDLLLSGVGTGLGSAIGGPVGGAIGGGISKLF